MATEELPAQLDVPLASLIELAIEGWRLDSWLASEPPEQSRVETATHRAPPAKVFARARTERPRPDGEHYEPGMSVEVIEALEDVQLGAHERVIDEMVEPVILWRGRVVRYGRVVVRQGGGESSPAGS
jgi:hypothetical protein